MPIYSETDLLTLRRAERLAIGKYSDLLFAYQKLCLTNPLAKEMAEQGFCRRLKVLVYCINTVFARIPPWSDAVPPREVRIESEVCAQAFIFNVFGCVDNLANLWVKERGVRRPDGKEIPPLLIGLGAKCTYVRATLSAEFQSYLSSDGMANWFGYLEDYRHALAHRIPLYIPPHSVRRKDVEKYQEFEQLKSEAAARLDFAEHDRLDEQQMKLCVFQPYIKHSWGDDRAPIRLHERMLGDYETVIDLGKRMLRQLSSAGAQSFARDTKAATVPDVFRQKRRPDSLN